MKKKKLTKKVGYKIMFTTDKSIREIEEEISALVDLLRNNDGMAYVLSMTPSQMERAVKEMFS